MNIAEKIANNIGRIRGAYASGLAKAFPNASFNDPRAWVSQGNFSGMGSAGPGKKPESAGDALGYFASWVYICTALNAKSCASVPLRLYGATPAKGSKIKWAGTDVQVSTRPISKARRKEFERARHLQPYLAKAEEVEEIVEHPFLDLIQTVNPYSNMSDLMELTIMFMDLCGDAYWYLVKNGAGVPEAIWSMPSQYIAPVPGKSLDEFITGYRFTRNMKDVIIPFEDALAFSYPNPKNQIIGMSPVVGVADAVYNNSQMNTYEAALFENKARCEGVFQVDGSVPQAIVDRATEDFEAKYAGAKKAGKSPLLPSGMTFTPTTQTNTELGFIEGRKLTREEIASGLDVPMSLLDPNAIRANVDAAQYHHAKYGLSPRLRKIEEKINERLIPMYDSGKSIWVAFDNVVPEDKQFELTARNSSTGVPYMSINEARAELGKDPVEGGDLPMVPFGVAPLGYEADTTTDTQAEELAEKTWKALRARMGIEA